MTMPPTLTGRDARDADRAGRLLRTPGRLAVAFSGGVDSSVLLAIAVRELGADRVLAVLGVSPSLAADERGAAHEVAAHVGAAVVEVETREGDSPAYRANGPDRCFHCKDELFVRISADVAAAHGVTAVAYGENADDARRPDRPGSRAAAGHGVLRALADAGLGKAAVRRIAAAFGLPSRTSPPHRAWRPGSRTSRRSPRRSWRRSRRRSGPCGGSGCATAGSGTTARSPASRCRSRTSRGWRASCARTPSRRCGGPGSAWSRSTWPASSRARSRCRWWRRGMADGWRPPESFARLDHDRAARRGYPEAVYCEGKTPEQVRAIAARRRDRCDGVALFAHAGPEHARAVAAELPDARHEPDARLLVWPPEPPEPSGGRVVVLAAAVRPAGGARGRADRAPPRAAVRAGRGRGGRGAAPRPRAARHADARPARSWWRRAWTGRCRASSRAWCPRRSSRCRRPSGTAPRSAGWRRCWRCSTRARRASRWSTSTTATAPGTAGADRAPH
nr:asparagine synthase-related protein [Actinomadura sp. CNU-125]